MENYNQQDLTFKIAERLDNDAEIKFIGTDLNLNIYTIEGLLSAYMEDLGLKLVIEDMAKFECGMNARDEDLPF